MKTRRGLLVGAFALTAAGCGTTKHHHAGEPYRVAALVHGDDFNSGLAQWRIEAESGSATVQARDGLMDIDTPAGLTAWFKPKLSGPTLIEYQATAVSDGGPNDRVSDLNAFWMATDSRSPAHILDRTRSGAFSDYDAMRTYYVGQGGNTNTTTRFRRYIGTPGNRPLLPQHDLSQPDDLLTPNVSQTVQLVAYGSLIQYWRDGKKLFEYQDSAPYTQGWFAIRTTKSHLRIGRLRIYRLKPR